MRLDGQGGNMWSKAGFLVVLGLAVLFAASGAQAGASSAVSLAPPGSTPDTTYVTNGTVNAITRAGNTIYLGGLFSEVGPRTGPFVGIDATTGKTIGNVPEVSGGDVAAVASDGAGGWFIGGDFTHVGGIARNRLAHVLADGSVDAAFAPNPDGPVYALMYFGGTLYVGGAFTSIGGQSRHDLAQLDVSGSATSFNPAPDQPVHALAAHSGTALHPSTLFIGGDFTSISGQSRLGIAELDLSGNALSWNPGDGGEVDALAVTGSGLAPLHVYVGGQFTSVADQAIGYIAELDATGAAVTTFNPSADHPVSAIAVSGGTVYAGGSFTHLGGLVRDFIGAVDSTTGAATSWNAGANGPVASLAVSGNTIYAGGGFTSMAGTKRNHLAALDATSGVATAWDPDANNLVEALAVSGTDVYAGGTFASIGGIPRSNLAAIDAATGAATSWNPGANGEVDTLAVANGIVYAGGKFSAAGSALRLDLAALDVKTGAATAWNPSANNVVQSLAVSGNTVYVAGFFSSVGGQARSYIAALNGTTGVATAWNPHADDFVLAIAVSGGAVYVGGRFRHIGGAARNYLAALDPTTGNATAWDPDANSWVFALATSGSTVYAGGAFTQVGSYLRTGLAAIATNGAVDAWNPAGVGPAVNGLAVSGSTVYVGGFGLAAFSASTGLATSWNPGKYRGYAYAVFAYSDGSIYVGGGFSSMDLAAQQGFASFSVLPANTTPPALSAKLKVQKRASCSTGAWLGSTPQSYAYAWLQDGVAISGATSSTYTPTPSTAGHRLSCRVTATNLGGSFSAVSKAVRPLACLVPMVTGKTLTAAKSAIVAAHCSVGKVTKTYSSQVKKGRVISENPTAHTGMPVGAKVALVVSRGAAP